MAQKFMVCLLVLAAATASAQTTWQVQAAGISFTDLTSNTNVTTITIGDSVMWTAISGGIHTVTNGTSTNDPNLGNLFNAPLDPFSGPTTFTYTPLTIGVIPYTCVIHDQCCLMRGTIVVLAPPSYPGSGHDLVMTTGVNGNPNPIDIKSASGGQILYVHVESPNGSLNFKPLLIGGQLMPQGGPAPVGIVPNLYINSSGGVLLVDGYSGYAIGLAQVVIPGGTTYGFLVPLGFAGLNMSAMIQTVVVAPGVANPLGVAFSNGHEIQLI